MAQLGNQLRDCHCVLTFISLLQQYYVRKCDRGGGPDFCTFHCFLHWWFALCKMGKKKKKRHQTNFAISVGQVIKTTWLMKAIMNCHSHDLSGQSNKSDSTLSAVWRQPQKKSDHGPRTTGEHTKAKLQQTMQTVFRVCLLEQTHMRTRKGWWSRTDTDS